MEISHSYLAITKSLQYKAFVPVACVFLSWTFELKYYEVNSQYIGQSLDCGASMYLGTVSV